MPFSFPDLGPETLEVLKSADRYNQWIVDELTPLLEGRCLELGSGIGTISSLLLKSHPDLCLSDFQDHYFQALQQRFPNSQKWILDLSDTEFHKGHENLLGYFDTLIAVNVLEHIEDDSLAISNAMLLLRPGGKLILLVPAFNGLHNSLDRHLHHYRRYTKQTIVSLSTSSGSTLTRLRYFNMFGALGWFLIGNIFRSRILKPWQVGCFNFFTPLAKWLDLACAPFFGLSLIAVIKKQE